YLTPEQVSALVAAQLPGAGEKPEKPAEGKVEAKGLGEPNEGRHSRFEVKLPAKMPPDRLRKLLEAAQHKLRDDKGRKAALASIELPDVDSATITVRDPETGDFGYGSPAQFEMILRRVVEEEGPKLGWPPRKTLTAVGLRATKVVDGKEETVEQKEGRYPRLRGAVAGGDKVPGDTLQAVVAAAKARVHQEDHTARLERATT